MIESCPQRETLYEEIKRLVNAGVPVSIFHTEFDVQPIGVSNL